ncbi:hypothetical protein B0H66DRAFT_600589 [Apodospora peruviana]|uniref:Uncharacterized protein n=1 Tax=Apodospora peruviana TaxID=516989 RepID=A0AAE0IK70_9PEZI|nr:hypothetical protein B0H66DRAFT_600589 [Apodospora peruviana]
MLGSYFLSTCLFAASGLAVPARRIDLRGTDGIVGHWSLSEFHRECSQDDNICKYEFNIDENNTGADGYACAFSVKGADDRPAGETDFHDKPCEQMSDRFRVNGGWDGRGFMTIVVTDVSLNALAFYGYTVDELEAGPITKDSPAYVVGTLANEASTEIITRSSEPEEETWQILEMSRNYDPVERSTHLDFTISLANGSEQHCDIDIPDTDNDATFWAQPCGNDFTVSWGYKEEADGAVMTVCNPGKKQNAWFGWDRISNQADLGDSPRNPVYPGDCQ